MGRAGLGRFATVHHDSFLPRIIQARMEIISRPSRGGGHPLASGESEDSWYDRKICFAEAVRDVITDTVYRRQKHPFLSPPATLNPKEKLSALVNDILRGPALASIPFLDNK